jgi:hypothetical protein
VELARIPGASGAVNVRLPDPTNDDNDPPSFSHTLTLIALAVDQAGNARANYRNLSIRHVAGRDNGVNNSPGDTDGANGSAFELDFLAPPSAVSIDAPRLADPGLPQAAGLVGQSQYILSYMNPEGFTLEGRPARLSFYYLAPISDPLRARLGDALEIGLPDYVASFNDVYYLIQDVEGDPYRVNWTLEPTQGLVALIFNDRGHSSPALDNLEARFMVRATALVCPSGPYSILADQPIVATYLVEWYNANGNVRYAMRYQKVAPPGPTTTLPGSFVFANPQTQLGTTTDGRGLAISHFVAGFGADDRSRKFDPNPPVVGPAAGTYRQILAVRDLGPPLVERTFALCPTFDVNP